MNLFITNISRMTVIYLTIVFQVTIDLFVLKRYWIIIYKHNCFINELP